jgi:hypothetical protein
MRPVNMMLEIHAMLETINGWNWTSMQNTSVSLWVTIESKSSGCHLIYQKKTGDLEVMLISASGACSKTFPYSDTALAQVKQFIEENN